MASDNSPTDRGQDALETENVIDTYQTIGEWIRFADTKAGVTLTVNGVLLGLLVPSLKTYLTEKDVVHPAEWWTSLVLVLFVGWLCLVVYSAIYSFRCILPIRGTGRKMALDHTTHFHPAAVSQAYPLEAPERFVEDCEKIGVKGLKREVLTAILIDSHLSSQKYGFVARSIQGLAISVVFGVLYLLAIQF